MIEEFYNPNQPRGKDGKWVPGGGAGVKKKPAPRRPGPSKPALPAHEQQAADAHAAVMKLAARHDRAAKSFATRDKNNRAKRQALADEAHAAFGSTEGIRQAIKANDPKVMGMLDRMHKLDAEHYALIKAQRTLGDTLNAKAHAAMAAPQGPAKLTVRSNLADNTNAHAATDFVGKLAGQGSSLESQSKNIVFNKVPDGTRESFKSAGGADARGSYTRGGYVRVSEKTSVATNVHEYGHGIEEVRPDIAAASKAFLDKRTAGEIPQKLSSLTGNRNYGDDEIAKPDKFFSPYVGKLYTHGSEILSMGLEQMYKDPVGFAKSDPEYFRHCMAMMRKPKPSQPSP